MSDGFLFLRDIVIVLGVGFLGAFIAKRLRFPLILGYLVGGFLFTVITASRFTFDASLETLSEIGVALLLFTLGIEFSLSHMAKVRNIAIYGGSLQILLTIIATLFILPAFGFSFKESLFLGSVFSFSSTAVVVKLLTDKGEINTPHGEILVGMLLLQDLAVIPLMILLPTILSADTFSFQILITVIISLLKAALIIGATFLLGRTLIPLLLQRVAKLASRELLLLSVMFLALGFAFLANVVGLPSSIGAFLAGLLIADSFINHAVFTEIRPLRDIFAIIFFVLLGMFLSPTFFFSHLPAIFLLTLFVVIIKSIIVFLLMIAFSYHTKTSFFVASSLTSIGEFAFVMAGLFVTKDLISPELYNLILSTSLLTILITPWQMKLAPGLYQSIKKALSKNQNFYNTIFGKLDYDKSFPEELPFENHVVILGHGRVGKVISKVLLRSNIPFVGVDYNLGAIEDLRKKGIPFVYGDPVDIQVMDFAQVDKAKVVVIAVPDRHSQEIIIRNAKTLNAKIKIICRTHFEEDKESLLSWGAHAVIQPEREAGLSIAQKILSLYNI